MQIFIGAFFLLFVLELIYFKIADRFNIIDKPNSRSSHSQITLRGGGIIFPIALIAGVVIYQQNQYYLAFGVFAIAMVSFLDDIITLNNKLRITVQLLSVLLIIAQIFINQSYQYSQVFGLGSWFLIVSFSLSILTSIILIIGIINAYNFMDGINGITVLYSIAAVGSFLIIQNHLSILFLNNNIFYLLLASLFVFGYFNLRKKAKAFAGDVGSIAIALIISFLICTIIVVTEDIKWILLLGVYGLDAVATIVCRIIRKENIFDAHRSHYYQFLANDKKWAHVTIAILYTGVQILLNLALIYQSSTFAYLIFFLMAGVYVFIRIKTEGKKRLFVAY